jgi:putative component of membrane protein insertase Oxa1/YidC/SpoIIIJ protein YidD
MRKQIREVKVWDIFTHAVFPPILAVPLWFFAIKQSIITPWIVYAASGIISYFFLRRFLIGLVFLYKAFAPMEIRNQCLFEPSCSTYMILSIKKYGIIYGVCKGLHRITRCRPPNGGIDYP